METPQSKINRVEVKVLNSFPTPIFTFNNPKHHLIEDSIVKDCYLIKNEDPGIERSNIYGWHSDINFFEYRQGNFQEIGAFMKSCILNATKQHMKKNVDNLQLLVEGWININPNGAFNAPHSHPEFTWSGVYYVKADNGIKKQNASIEFIDPRGGANVLALFASKVVIPPNPGTFILFPSYLNHWVPPNESDSDRISIAINAKFSRKKSKLST